MIDGQDIDAQVRTVVNHGKQRETCSLSVVIVTYKRNYDLIACLDSLRTQSYDDFEVIVVDNGGNEEVVGKLGGYDLKYVKLKDNYGPSSGRNIGTYFSKGNVVCFLDDDGIADIDFCREHLRAHEDHDLLAIRGRIAPKTDIIYNDLQSHYDLGDEMRESYIGVEGNCSIKREALVAVGGFAPRFFGGEGLELSYRIAQRFGKEKLIYYPGAVIYHDYATSMIDYLEKVIRHERMRRNWLRKHPEITQFIDSYSFKAFDRRRGSHSLARRLWTKAITKLILFGITVARRLQE